MPSTIFAHDGDLYHSACLSDEERGVAREIPVNEVEDDEICNECMEPLVSEDTPEDVPEAS